MRRPVRWAMVLLVVLLLSGSNVSAQSGAGYVAFECAELGFSAVRPVGWEQTGYCEFKRIDDLGSTTLSFRKDTGSFWILWSIIPSFHDLSMADFNWRAEGSLLWWVYAGQEIIDDISRTVVYGAGVIGSDTYVVSLTTTSFDLQTSQDLVEQILRQFSPLEYAAAGDLTQYETLGRTAVSSNGEWEPVSATINDVEMVLVPAGCFMMGSTEEQLDFALEQCELNRGEGKCDREWWSTGGVCGPETLKQVCFEEPFWIDRYEVTNGQFEQFDGKAAVTTPAGWDQRPRLRVEWDEALAFCGQRGARLPLVQEWEYAARGPDSLIYPWGNRFEASYLSPDPGLLNGQADDVGSFPAGASWVGALDMAGNAYEWVVGDIVMGDGLLVQELRGGSRIYQSSEWVRSALRDYWHGREDVGFRCARSQ